MVGSKKLQGLIEGNKLFRSHKNSMNWLVCHMSIITRSICIQLWASMSKLFWTVGISLLFDDQIFNAVCSDNSFYFGIKPSSLPSSKIFLTLLNFFWVTFLQEALSEYHTHFWWPSRRRPPTGDPVHARFSPNGHSSPGPTGKLLWFSAFRFLVFKYAIVAWGLSWGSDIWKTNEVGKSILKIPTICLKEERLKRFQWFLPGNRLLLPRNISTIPKHCHTWSHLPSDLLKAHTTFLKVSYFLRSVCILLTFPCQMVRELQILTSSLSPVSL